MVRLAGPENEPESYRPMWALLFILAAVPVILSWCCGLDSRNTSGYAKVELQEGDATARSDAAHSAGAGAKNALDTPYFESGEHEKQDLMAEEAKKLTHSADL